MVERKFRLPRVWSNGELARLAPLFPGAVVNVSGWKDQDKEGRHYREYFTQATSYTITNYGGFRGFQGDEKEILLDLSVPVADELRGRFDVVFNHTTLEHIFEARTAFKNLCEMSRDIVIVVLPFSQVQHEEDTLKDFWRFTPTCVRYLFRENGMTPIYEAVNDHHNAGVYVVTVGTKYPEKWAGKLPSYRECNEAAWRVGASWKERLRRLVRR